MTHDELLKRLREATGAELELDGLIAQAFGLLPPEARYSTENVYGECEPHWVAGGFGDYKFFEPEPYTSSLDAAIVLVEKMLADCSWNVESEQYYDKGTIRPRFTARLRAQRPPRLYVVATFATPALALLIALLEALSAKGEPKP